MRIFARVTEWKRTGTGDDVLIGALYGWFSQEDIRAIESHANDPSLPDRYMTITELDRAGVH